MSDNYTQYPRPILWLVRGGGATIGGVEDDSLPAFTVSVASFYLSKLPVTNVQFEAFDPTFVRGACSRGDEDPAVGVDFEQAHGYCDWYARVSRKPMRLPTEVEWEYACRGGTTTRYFFGDSGDEVGRHIWHEGNSGEIMPPLKKARPNPFGLHSMLGGVWEWTASLYRAYPVEEEDGRDAYPAAGLRVLRGGSFRTSLERIGSGVRRACEPERRGDDVGFRVGRSLRARPGSG
jgi:formylglycine-generating enzyme required for sulfatase activity